MTAQKGDTLHGLSAALAASEVMPPELVERALRRAAGTPKTFISLRSEAALEEAEQSAARWRSGKPLSALDGIPIGWKDLFDIKGTVTTAGSRAIALKAMVAQNDAAVVQNTRRLGLISIGKTNLTELAYSGLGLNPHYGTPGDGTRVPGGSSSGSAIAVKDGIVAAAIGTDTAGSIRIPAAFNGLVGFKSSSSRYDMNGVFPLQKSFDSLGPICWTVADCVTMDAAMRGMGKPNVLPAMSPPKFIIDSGILEDPGLTEAVREDFTAFIRRLKDAGAGVDNHRVEAVERSRIAFRTIGWLGSPEAYALHKDLLAGPSRELLDERVAKRLEMAGTLDAEAVASLSKLRAELMENISRELDGALLLMPTVKHIAPPMKALESDAELFAKVNLATLSLTMIGSFLNMPGVALPTGTERGSETSALLSGTADFDDVVLSAALWVQKNS